MTNQMNYEDETICGVRTGQSHKSSSARPASLYSPSGHSEFGHIKVTHMQQNVQRKEPDIFGSYNTMPNNLSTARSGHGYANATDWKTDNLSTVRSGHGYANGTDWIECGGNVDGRRHCYTSRSTTNTSAQALLNSPFADAYPCFVKMQEMEESPFELLKKIYIMYLSMLESLTTDQICKLDLPRSRLKESDFFEENFSDAYNARHNLRMSSVQYFSKSKKSMLFNCLAVQKCFTDNMHLSEFDPKKAVFAFEHIERLAINLVLNPWKCEYHRISKCSAAYIHHWNTALMDADKVIACLGYVDDVHHNEPVLALKEKPDQSVIQVALNCYLASVFLDHLDKAAQEVKRANLSEFYNWESLGNCLIDNGLKIDIIYKTAQSIQSVRDLSKHLPITGHPDSDQNQKSRISTDVGLSQEEVNVYMRSNPSRKSEYICADYAGLSPGGMTVGSSYLRNQASSRTKDLNHITKHAKIAQLNESKPDLESLRANAGRLENAAQNDRDSLRASQLAIQVNSKSNATVSAAKVNKSSSYVAAVAAPTLFSNRIRSSESLSGQSKSDRMDVEGVKKTSSSSVASVNNNQLKKHSPPNSNLHSQKRMESCQAISVVTIDDNPLDDPKNSLNPETPFYDHEAPNSPWNCPKCTFQNLNNKLRCGLCNSLIYTDISSKK